MTITQLFFVDYSMVLEKVTPRIFISLAYGMPSGTVVLLHPPTASVFDFLVFRRAPFAFL